MSAAASFTEKLRTYEWLVKLPEGMKEQVTLIYLYSYYENGLKQAALLQLSDGTVLNVRDNNEVETIHELKDAHISSVSACADSVFVFTDSSLYYRGLLCSRDIESIQGFSAAPWKLTGAVKVRCGWSHVMVLMNDGRVMGWGCNDDNQIAAGDRKEVPEPEEVLTDVLDMDVGDGFTAALCKDGAVWVWGRVDAGRLKYNKPTKIHIGEPVTSVSCGYCHIMMLGVSGSVYCVGYNKCGQCGNGSDDGLVATPVRVGDVRAKEIYAGHLGGYSSCITLEGSVLVWGRCKMGEDKRVNIRAPQKPNCGAYEEPCRSLTAAEARHCGHSITMKEPLRRDSEEERKLVSQSGVSQSPTPVEAAYSGNTGKEEEGKQTKGGRKAVEEIKNHQKHLSQEMNSVEAVTMVEVEREKVGEQLKEEAAKLQAELQKESGEMRSVVREEREEMYVRMQREWNEMWRRDKEARDRMEEMLRREREDMRATLKAEREAMGRMQAQERRAVRDMLRKDHNDES